MKICITLDDVLRAKTSQFGKIYKKHINPDIDLETLDFSSGDLCKIFNFKNKKEYETFLYVDYVFDIFAEAITCEKMLDKKLNLWLLGLDDNEDLCEPVELMLSNTMEFNASIGFTYFFISKTATRIREVFLPSDSSEIWDKCDVLITADTKLLKNKPQNKVVVKIETDYNKECDADFTYDKLSSFLEDKEILNKIQKLNVEEHVQ